MKKTQEQHGFWRHVILQWRIRTRHLTVEEKTDDVVELLDDIISWEKNLGEYKSLEQIIRSRYLVISRPPDRE